MSDSSSDFDRSQLERKDREQLVEIAAALGRKPPSRARKAEVVDLILELAGVTTAADATPADAMSVDDATEPVAAVAAVPGGDAAGAPAAAAPKPGEPTRAPSGGDNAERTATTTTEGNGNGNDRAPRPATDAAPDAEGDDGETGAEAGTSNDAQNDQNGRRRRRRGRGGNVPAEGQPEPEPIDVEGILDLRDDGYGFLRLRGYLGHRDDSYVSVKQVRQFGLRRGDRIKGLSRPPTRSEKNPALLRIDEVNGAEPHLARERPRFANLTPEYPTEPLRLEHRDTIVDMTARIIDLVAPIGKGQRGLIVAPPKSGKTTILKTIARAIEQNHPEAHLMVLLVDERPEEVTDFQRWIGAGEVVASTFDRPAEEHTTVAELAIERAKRIAESGGDVVLLVDGITRLTRAYNLTVKESGRLMSGGIDAAAIWPAKRFFGAARKLAEGGSLTILATALVDTNSRMDDHIFEEFKGTGNAELRLDRRLAESRTFPAIDVAGSGTRHEELLFTKPEQVRIAKLRRVLAAVPDDGNGPGGAMRLLIERLQAFKSNEDFLAEVAKS
ncbi:MAG: transcription termination factor Rho [Actinobacteria bacterium]|nr:transcription termination factor Rho [Actinomycetota bacterium]